MASPNRSWDQHYVPAPPAYNYTKYGKLLASKQILKSGIKDLPLSGRQTGNGEYKSMPNVIAVSRHKEQELAMYRGTRLYILQLH